MNDGSKEPSISQFEKKRGLSRAFYLPQYY
jgi:hypothetical protein